MGRDLRGVAMVKWMRGVVGLAMAATAPGAAWAAERNVSLKSGETTEIGTVYSVVNCRSTLKEDPTLDVLEAPPDVTVTLRKEKVVPNSRNCKTSVPGGTLVLKAPKDVKARTEGRLTLRLNIVNTAGKHQSTREYNVILFP